MQAPPPRAVVNVHPLSHYSFGHAPARFDKGGTAAERQARMQERYAAEGARRTVEGIILVNEHSHPHVLLLQARTRWAARGRSDRAASAARGAALTARRQVEGGQFALPGGKLKPGEDEVEGLKRKLRSKLAPAASSVAINWEARRRAARPGRAPVSRRAAGGRVRGQLVAPRLRGGAVPVRAAAHHAAQGVQARLRGAPA